MSLWKTDRSLARARMLRYWPWKARLLHDWGRRTQDAMHKRIGRSYRLRTEPNHLQRAKATKEQP